MKAETAVFFFLRSWWTHFTRLRLFLLSFSFGQFATYSQGSTVWLQWLTVASILSFMMVFDFNFTNESNFMFDPDADNWRRKTVSDTS